MRQKLLLLLMLFSFGAMSAQNFAPPEDTIWTLIISEARVDRADMYYIELTNIGTYDVQLSEFELLSHNPWTGALPGAWPSEPHRPDGRWTMLPDHVLAPGESFIIATAQDYHEWRHAWDVEKFGYSRDYGRPWNIKPEVSALTDFPIHRGEGADKHGFEMHDSISVHSSLGETWNGRDVTMLRHHPAAPGSDSCIVDNVGGTWEGGEIDAPENPNGPKDVAGYTNATASTTLIRRASVTQGNPIFVQGNSIDESEWIPVPHLSANAYEPERATIWTLGNHANIVLDETTLKSTEGGILIDWDNHTMTVPWGVRHDDSIMHYIDYQPGLAWHYDHNSGETGSMDSLYSSVRTGDTLTTYAVGDDLDVIKWHLIAAAPTADENVVIPMKRRNRDGSVPGTYGTLFDATVNPSGIDTIFDIPFGTRVDTLFKYFEKPANANWAIDWVDSNERADLKDGDKLVVTAEDGSSVKEYVIKVEAFRKDRNAYLSSITWPDIPEYMKGLFGWTGDTIPSFSRVLTEYQVSVPWNYDGIPALVAKNEDDNATNTVKRATTMSGSPADRTVTITSVAEDDTSMLVYNILFEKQKNAADLQPWTAEPFISQYVHRAEWWSNNVSLELVNPGTEAIDMSNYMVVGGYFNDVTSAVGFGDDYANRYQKYIPGRTWKNPDDNAGVHSLADLDLTVTTNVWGGDVFCMTEYSICEQGYIIEWEDWAYKEQSDIDFRHMQADPDYEGGNVADQWLGANIYLFKIVGDSVREGWKAATDPEDFELLDVYGTGDGSNWAPIGDGSSTQVVGYTRKAHIWHGNTDYGVAGSFGLTEEESEWTMLNESRLGNRGYGWPDRIIHVHEGLGSHFMEPVTVYLSTISSTVYKTSTGYSEEETIAGILPNTSVSDFLANIIKANDGQTLSCVAAVGDGSPLADTDILLDGDTLVVNSYLYENTTKYIISVGAFSDDAVLTSSTYTVAVTGATGTVSGVPFGVTVKDLVGNLTVPAGAVMTVVNGKDEWVPNIKVNFDTAYVDVKVTEDTYLEVVAEDGATTVLYSMVPDYLASDAYVVSDVYVVDDASLLIDMIPEFINVEAFLSNLTAAPGASIKLYDVFGFERLDGTVALDDQLEVTSEDASTVVVYNLGIMTPYKDNLAYVTSSVYTVDAKAKTIATVSVATTVANFLADLTPSEGATMEVQTSDGTAKTDTDDVAPLDKLEVTAANGITVNYYQIDCTVGIEDRDGFGVSIYPNPSNGLVHVDGAATGSLIRVFNAQGSLVVEREAQNMIETISLDGQASGMYFITISNGTEVSGQYKVLKF